jgi:hypothetical protein
MEDDECCSLWSSSHQWCEVGQQVAFDNSRRVEACNLILGEALERARKRNEARRLELEYKAADTQATN